MVSGRKKLQQTAKTVQKKEPVKKAQKAVIPQPKKVKELKSPLKDKDSDDSCNSFDIDFAKGKEKREDTFHRDFSMISFQQEAAHSRKESVCPTEETIIEHLDIEERKPTVEGAYKMPMIRTLNFLNKRCKSNKPKHSTQILQVSKPTKNRFHGTPQKVKNTAKKIAQSATGAWHGIKQLGE